MFNGIMDYFKGIFKNEKGQGMVEYILIVLLIALVAYFGFQTLGGTINNEVDDASTSLENAACLYMGF